MMNRYDIIKTPKVDRVLLRQFHHSRDYVTGTLCLTDRHLIFVEPTGTQETWVLYHHISSTERLPLTTRGYPLIILTKTFHQLHLIIPRESDCVDVIDTIKGFAQPEKYSELYAFHYRPKEGEMVKQSSGWALFDSQNEYSRMGVPNKFWRATSLNQEYEMCPTYSAHLYVPAAADDSVVRASAKFRSKGRLPALSYYYAPKNTALCRCSQPLGGLIKRSVEDEQMIQAIVDANPNKNFMYCVDTRPKINAVANKAVGKGYESTDHYSNLVYEFYNIHNIHIMRESLQKLVEATCSPSQTVSGFLQGLESSGWLRHIQLILECSIFAAKSLCLEGVSVLVHCSDGWDRTAQTCALIALLIDPYYRTLHGFMILIEKEWLYFGHKFSTRYGHLAGDIRETSPIFTQFLECVWQVMIQFPTAFQFNEQFLVTLHDHIYSNQFGTFLGNCERERKEERFNEQTYSFWGFVWVHLDDFINPLFHPAKAAQGETLILPVTDIPHLSFWKGLYCRYPLKQHICELTDEILGSLKQQNTCIAEYIKFLQQNIEELKIRLARFQAIDNVVLADGEVNSNGEENKTASDCPKRETVSEGESSNPTQTESETKCYSLQAEGDCEQEEVGNSQNKESSEEMDGKVDCKIDGEVGNKMDGEVDKKMDGPQTLEGHNSIDAEDPPSLTVMDPDSTLSGSTPLDDHSMDRTGTMSPKSFATFKGFLVHTPEMNLPWESMRSVRQCTCGVTFSYSIRRYHCSHCGVVVCGACGSHQAPLPWQNTHKPHRVCKACFKLMRRRLQDMDVLISSS